MAIAGEAMQFGRGPGGRARRVLWVQPAVAVGGAERQASLVLPLLERFGLEATCVVGPGREILDWVEEQDLQQFQWDPRFPAHGEYSLARLPAFVRGALELMRGLDVLHARAPFDVVVGSLGFGWAVAGLRARAWGIPAVWRAGGLSYGASLGASTSAARWLRVLRVLARPEVLLCNAEAVARFWHPVLHLPVRVVRNGVQLPDELPHRPPAATFVVGFLGRLATEKNLPLLLEAVALARARGARLRAIVAGPGDRAPLECIARRLGLADVVEVRGAVRDVGAFYRELDAFVLASDHEGCPNVLLEAMAHGNPVVATAVGGIPELVTHGREGLLVPPQHAGALADALVSLAADRAFARALGSRARERAATHSPALCAEQIAQLLHAVVGSRRSPDRRYG